MVMYLFISPLSFAGALGVEGGRGGWGVSNTLGILLDGIL